MIFINVISIFVIITVTNHYLEPAIICTATTIIVISIIYHLSPFIFTTTSMTSMILIAVSSPLLSGSKLQALPSDWTAFKIHDTLNMQQKNALYLLLGAYSLNPLPVPEDDRKDTETEKEGGTAAAMALGEQAAICSISSRHVLQVVEVAHTASHTAIVRGSEWCHNFIKFHYNSFSLNRLLRLSNSL